MLADKMAVKGFNFYEVVVNVVVYILWFLVIIQKIWDDVFYITNMINEQMCLTV